MQSVDNVKNELHKNITVRKEKKKNYKMESNNGIGNMELSEREVSEVYESIDLEKYCDENMTGLERFYEQEPRIENKDCKDKTSEGKDQIIIGLFRKNFEQNLTKSDEDLVNNLVDLGQKNIVLNIDINEGLNVFDVGDRNRPK